MDRIDGRNDAMQLRPTSSAQGVLAKCDGSAKFSFGNALSVLVSVNGPLEAKFKDEQLDKATINVIFKPLEGSSTILERYYERFIHDVAETLIISTLHPRTTIQIVAQVLAGDGCLRSATINALVLALINAGIPIRCIVSAVTCAFDTEANLILDPTLLEIQNAQSVHLFCFERKDKGDGGMIIADSTGWIKSDDYFACIDICQMAADKVHSFLRMAVEKRLKQEFSIE